MADNSPSCAIVGNADMYGLGVRLGFYLQWCASIAANTLMVKTEIATIRFAIYSYLTAVFIALSIQTAQGGTSHLDRYLVLLLCFGSYYSQVPIFLWRMGTCFREKLDPTRWMVLPSSLPLRVYSQVIFVAVLAWQYYFWATLSPGPDETTCPQYGFLFVPVPLYGVALKAVNLSLSSFLVCILLWAWVKWCLAKWAGSNDEFLKPTKIHTRDKTMIRLKGLVDLVVAGIVMAATELTLHWNSVQGVYSLDTLGQVVTLILGLVVLLRVFWVKLKRGLSVSESLSKDPDIFISDALHMGRQDFESSFGGDPRIHVTPGSQMPQQAPYSSAGYIAPGSPSTPNPTWQA
ncbi:hypothetical protein QBC47DRAFT_436607 [Echria macrotheca]|uniref:Uncharacterized protein n=1 Tax=Echria macrotheca TaxID=438768 RepID=A0AAJ0BIV2_9PEZI|nr:hypothetical protein QBC47DRAFT_436607 [Echria macrotheca]